MTHWLKVIKNKILNPDLPIRLISNLLKAMKEDNEKD